MIGSWRHLPNLYTVAGFSGHGMMHAPAAGRGIAELVVHKRLVAGSLVVELNQQIIKQEQWPFTSLKDGDSLELLNFVGGG